MDNNPLHTTASGGNLGPVFFGIDWAVFSLSTIIVALRLYTRLFITRNFGLDDATIALTQMITAVGKGFVVTEVSYGLGQHRIDLSVEQYRNFLKYYYLDTAQFFIALATCKISICLFLLRLSHFNELKRILYGLILFLIATHLALFFLNIFQCSPVDKVWNLDDPGRCFSEQTVMNILIAQGVLSFTTDFTCAAFPIVLLRNLKIRTRSKMALCCLMGLGIVTGGIAIARTATAWQVKSADLSWVGVPNAMTRIFEVNIGNVAACVPILKPFGRYVRARVTGRDPHEMLRRRKASPSPSHPNRWYPKRFRLRRPSPAYVKSEREPRQVPAEVGRAPRSVGRESSATEGTLGLPLQGLRESFFNISIPHLPYRDVKDDFSEALDLRGQESKGSLRMDVGELSDVKDIV